MHPQTEEILPKVKSKIVFFSLPMEHLSCSDLNSENLFYTFEL